MKNPMRGFTITELLVAMTITAILLAVLFPVFSQAKKKAHQTGWIEAQRQLGLATNIYLVDYDDRYMIAQYLPVGGSDPTIDRTWVQTLLPYAKEFSLFLCPADQSREHIDIVSSTQTGDPYSRYYRASMKSNSGYNFLYFAPVIFQNGWQSRPRSQSEFDDPSTTLMFGDSAWETIDGVPRGGGNFLIVPPCRYRQNDNGDSFDLGSVPINNIFIPDNPWQSVTQAQVAFVAGGLYPWYFQRVTTVNALGGVKTRTLTELTNGCDVRPDWNGYITDSNAYIWDAN